MRDHTFEQEERIHELDSLRGLAALSVVFLHFHDLFFSWERTASLSHKTKLVAGLLSPFYLGHEAVVLFFALSGYVLALPYLKGRELPYSAFVTRRIIRIYLPYLFALALSVGGDALWHGHLGLGDWAEGIWSEPVSSKLVLQHILFLGNYNWVQINTVFWSLVYEMRISLIFPALFILVNRVNTVSGLLVAAALPLVERGFLRLWPHSESTFATMNYMAIFICGILMLKNRDDIGKWYRGLRSTQKIFFVCCVFVLYGTGHFLPHLSGLATLAGALGWIALALHSDSCRRLLNNPVPIYLGRISFSLYLVHIPILFAMAFMLNGKIPRILFFGGYVALAILGGTVFYQLVEKPCIRLAHLVAGKRRITAPPVAA